MGNCIRILILFTIFGCSDNNDNDMRLFTSSLNSGSGVIVTPPVYGCTNPLAENYNPLATIDDGSCTFAPEPLDGYLLFPIYGQSLSLGFSTTGIIDPFSGLLQFSDGLIGQPNGSSTLVQLVKFKDNATILGNYLLTNRSVEDTRKLVFTTPGVNGTAIADLSRGTAPYTKLIAGVTELKRIADAEGKLVRVPAVPFMQGEQDLRAVNNFYYEASLNTLVTQLNEDIKAITGQTTDVILLISQQASHPFYARYPRIALQQYTAAINNPLIHFAYANYFNDFNNDEVHLTPQGYQLQGAQMGEKVLTSILNNQGKKAITIQSHTYASLKSTIVFNVPYSPLVFDTTQVTSLPDGNYGFKLFDVFESTTNKLLNTIAEPAATITSVVLVGANTVEITYSSNPAGSRLTYGINGSVWNQVTGVESMSNDAGRDLGARGNLRDSQGNTKTWNCTDGYVPNIFLRLDNWCPIFEIQL